MPERGVAGFSLRPIPSLSQARDPRVAIGLQPGLAPPVLRYRTGFVIASLPEPFDFAQGEGRRGNRLNGEIATAPRRGMWKGSPQDGLGASQ